MGNEGKPAFKSQKSEGSSAGSCLYWRESHQLTVVAPFTDTAEVIQSRLNEQEGREEFYVHYVGCKYKNTLIFLNSDLYCMFHLFNSC